MTDAQFFLTLKHVFYLRLVSFLRTKVTIHSGSRDQRVIIIINVKIYVIIRLL